jgi:hypothetical protein
MHYWCIYHGLRRGPWVDQRARAERLGRSTLSVQTPVATKERNIVSLSQQYPEAPEPITARRVRDELVLVLDAGFALVASKSEADVWHVVEHGRCSCPGFRYREQCRHLQVALEAYQTPCYRCGAAARIPEPGLLPTCGSCHKTLITLADD